MRQGLTLLLSLVALLSVGVAATYLANLRARMVAEASQHASAAARLLEEHVLRTFRATEFLIDQVSDLARERSLDELRGDRKAWLQLKHLAEGLPEPGTLWVIGADGHVVLGSLSFPFPANDVSDRYYYEAHRQSPDRGLVIGPLVQVKSRDMQAFHLSKRITTADGSFKGVAAAGIDLGYFTGFHNSLSLGPNATIAIFDAEGRVILRQPQPERWVDRTVAGGPIMMAAMTEKKGVITSPSPLDGIDRLVAYRRIEPYGVIVATGVAMDDALEGWWAAVAAMASTLAILAALLGSVAVFAFRGINREEALLASLEARVEERTREAELRAAEAREANETKTKFLAAASHDLRQPLQAAGMFAEVLSVRTADTPMFAIVDKLRQSIEATQALLTTLLDVSTLEAGRVEPNVGAVPLAPLMANLLDQLEPEASRRQLELRMVPTGLWVRSDPVLLERTLRNLLVNAVAYTGKGKVLIGCRRRGNEVAIQVVDTGCGIPADKLNEIFEDFTRLGDKGSGASRGLGLGLSVVRRMTRLMGHRIEVRSTPGKGSMFAVVVPVARR
ncbi:MAG: ATP-binding protein [Solirubrobacterales bacterium]